MQLEDNLQKLQLDCDIEQKLSNLKIYSIQDLWKCNSSYLKQRGFQNCEINHIRIKLQLQSIDLNQKRYHA